MDAMKLAKMNPQQALIISRSLIKEAEKIDAKEKNIVRLDAMIAEDCEYKTENSDFSNHN